MRGRLIDVQALFSSVVLLLNEKMRYLLFYHPHKDLNFDCVCIHIFPFPSFLRQPFYDSETDRLLACLAIDLRMHHQHSIHRHQLMACNNATAPAFSAMPVLNRPPKLKERHSFMDTHSLQSQDSIELIELPPSIVHPSKRLNSLV